MCQDILDARVYLLLDKTLEAHRDQRDEVTPGPSIIFRTAEKLDDGLERLS
jgi:hypothetical protein